MNRQGTDSVGAGTPPVKTHSPGPWKVVKIEDSGDDWSVAATGNLVIETNHIKSDELGTEEADARLIAAAPDLLAALQGMLEDDGPHVSLAKQREHWDARMDAARTAVAKATEVPS